MGTKKLHSIEQNSNLSHSGSSVSNIKRKKGETARYIKEHLLFFTTPLLVNTRQTAFKPNLRKQRRMFSRAVPALR